MMAREGLSNRQRKHRAKAAPAAPRHPKAVDEAKVVRVAKVKDAGEPIDRDGLIWPYKKKRITAAQAKEGFHYRDLFRSAAGGEAPIPSNIPTGKVGGGQQGGLPFSDGFNDAAAKLALFVVRWHVLLGQADLLLVMDGVCGVGHTVRYLAGGNQVRAAQLEAALRIALDMMSAARKAKEDALAKFPQKAA
jgi:hypothetical protein